MQEPTKCDRCQGVGLLRDTPYTHPYECPKCAGDGFVGIAPKKATDARPGTLLKVAVLRRRYWSGLPLYHEDDATVPMPAQNSELYAAMRTG